MFAGTLRDHASFEGEPIEGECERCGQPMVIDYAHDSGTIESDITLDEALEYLSSGES